MHVLARERGTDVLRPLADEHPDDETIPGLRIVRPEGRLFFVNAQTVAERVKALVAHHQPRVLVLDMSVFFDIEYSALQMLIEAGGRALHGGTTLRLTGLNPGVHEVVRRSKFAERLGRERMLFNAQAAIERFQLLPTASVDPPGSAVA